MATVKYTGKAVAVAQVSTVDVGAYDAATTYSLTINGVSITTIAQGSAEATATKLVSNWNASTHPYFTPITAAVGSGSPSNTITLTGDEAGFPFTASASASGGSGTMGSVSATTAATGPNHWSAANNWSTLAVPVTGDVVIIDKPSARLCWDLDQSGVSPTALLSSLTVRGDTRIGLASASVATSADGETTSATAPEYRDQYLKVGITTTTLGPNQNTLTPSGSGRIKIHNTATGAATCTVSATAAAAVDSSLPAIRLLADSANWDLFVESARAGVGVGVEAGETGTVGDLYLVDGSGVSKLIVGNGITHSTIVQHGGVAEIDAGATMPAITVNAGSMTIKGTQAITALTTNGGRVVNATTGNTATVTQNDGEIDWTKQVRTRTVTNYNYYSGTRVVDHGVLTITNDNRTGRTTETMEAL